MTKVLEIYGASDDLIETDGIDGCDEFCDASDLVHKGRLMVGTGRPNETMDIHVIYDGCWTFAISGFDNESERPADWPVTRSWRGHSEVVEIEVPNDTRLRYESNDKG